MSHEKDLDGGATAGITSILMKAGAVVDADTLEQVAIRLGYLGDHGVQIASLWLRSVQSTGKSTDLPAELRRLGLPGNGSDSCVERAIAEREPEAGIGMLGADATATLGVGFGPLNGRQPGDAAPLPDIHSLAPHRTDLPSTFDATPASPASESDIGLAAEPKYTRGRLLGRGGMGRVTLARDRDLQRDVAIKTPTNPDDQRLVEKFIEEAQIAGQLEHPNIVPIYDLGVVDSQPLLVMRRVTGETLLQIIERTGRSGAAPLTAEELNQTLGIFRQVAQAVAFAHHRHVVHCDIKPANVMVGRFGEVLLMDWGLARLLQRDMQAHGTGKEEPAAMRTTRVDRTRDGQIKGSPAWMPPEQARGDVHAIDERSDVFALGALLYHQLTLQAPFRGETSRVVLAMAARAQYVRPRALAPGRDIPPELDAIVRKAMALDPHRRYQSVTQLLADIDAFRAHRPITARRDGPLRWALKWSRRNPRAALAAVLSVVFASILAAIVMYGLHQLAAADARAARNEQDRLFAEKERLLAEQARLQAEQEVAKAHTERLKELATKQKFQQIAKELGAQYKRKRDAAIQEFDDLADEAFEKGMEHADFLWSVPPEQLARYRASLDDLLTAWQSAPEVVEVTARDWSLRAMLRMMDGDYQKAVDDYDRALELDPGRVVSFFGRAFARSKLGRFEEAIEDLERAYDLMPQEGLRTSRGRLIPKGATLNQLFNALGVAQMELGRHAKALAWFEDALKCQPLKGVAHGVTLLNRGDALIHLGRSEASVPDLVAAKDLFDEVIGDGIERVSPYYYRAIAKSLLGWDDAARIDYDIVLRLDPGNQSARYNRAVSRQHLGDYEGAIEDYSRTIEQRTGNADAWLGRGNCRAQLGWYSQAFDDFSEALVLDPRNSFAYLNRGKTRIFLNQPNEAVLDFAMSTVLDPGCWEGWLGQAMTLASLGFKMEARMNFSKALGCCPPGERERVEKLRLQALGE
ncbi:MAG: tetratricopeptide repeat protein [Planctomycetota bacterium]